MNALPAIGDIIRRLASTLAFGATIATLLVLCGTRDLESYENAFFSLNRGTAAETVQVLGHPVYTLALGLGVRLPLQGNLDASPAALFAPYMPAPLTYWLLMTLAIDLDTIRQSVSVISDQLGVVATVFLFACWGQAIALGGSVDRRIGRTGAATRGALLAALILVLAGAVPEAAIGPAWMIALGILLGLAEARPGKAGPWQHRGE